MQNPNLLEKFDKHKTFTITDSKEAQILQRQEVKKSSELYKF